jgi:hypothetical protein
MPAHPVRTRSYTDVPPALEDKLTLLVQFMRSASSQALVFERYKQAMSNLLKRPWKVGEVYAPHDMSAAEQRKWRQSKATTVDCFDVLNIDPLSLYKVRPIAIHVKSPLTKRRTLRSWLISLLTWDASSPEAKPA